MSNALLDSPGMAKTRDTVKPPRPDDEVRFVCNMTRDERARLKAFCARIGQDMESIGARWILDRLAAEERKLAK
jgi:hypothetical protein